VSDFWKNKISKNRERDIKNHQKLREMGWTVICLWQHEVEQEFETCIERIVTAVSDKKNPNENGCEQSIQRY